MKAFKELRKSAFLKKPNQGQEQGSASRLALFLRADCRAVEKCLWEDCLTIRNQPAILLLVLIESFQLMLRPAPLQTQGGDHCSFRLATQAAAWAGIARAPGGRCGRE